MLQGTCGQRAALPPSESPLRGLCFPGLKATWDPDVPATCGVQAGRPWLRRQRTWRFIFDVTSLL